MSDWRGTTTWALQCQKCQRFFDWSDRLRLFDDQPHHYDLFTELWCGPVIRVELRSADPD